MRPEGVRVRVARASSFRETPALDTDGRGPASNAASMATERSVSTAEAPPILCPGCGGANDADAVFCGNAECGKALGEFRYVREELLAAARWHELLADRVSSFVGKPQFL